MTRDSRPEARDGLVRRLAAALRLRALQQGAWAADVGVLGEDAFLEEAAETLEAIATGRVEGGPPAP